MINVLYAYNVAAAEEHVSPQQQKMYPTQPCGGVNELNEFTS